MNKLRSSGIKTKTGFPNGISSKKRPDDLIISASPACIIEPIARRLGVNYVATEYDREYNVFVDNLMYAKEKAKYIFRLSHAKRQIVNYRREYR